MQADIDLLFADWSEPATFCQITRAYEPATGLLVESATETPILVIATDTLVDPADQTAAQAACERRTFHIRPAELPEPVDWTNARVRCRNETFQILRQIRSAQSLLISLDGVRIDVQEAS